MVGVYFDFGRLENTRREVFDGEVWRRRKTGG
jgi:hypothetical protein